MQLTLGRIIVLTAATTLAYPALQQAAPGLMARTNAYLSAHTGWDESACEADPTGCLDAKATQLRALGEQVSVSLDALRAEQGRVEAMVAEQSLLQAKNQAFLEQGRGLYQTHLANPDAPLMFAGRRYPDLETFKLQLELLFKEQRQRQASVAAAEDLQQQLNQRLDALSLKHSEIAQQQAMIPTQRELLKVDRTFGEIADTINAIDKVLQDGRETVTEADDGELIATTADLMRRLAASQPVTGAVEPVDTAFQAFLAEGGQR